MKEVLDFLKNIEDSGENNLFGWKVSIKRQENRWNIIINAKNNVKQAEDLFFYFYEKVKDYKTKESIDENRKIVCFSNGIAKGDIFCFDKRVFMRIEGNIKFLFDE